MSSLLKLAIPLVKTHGFTREALSLSVLHLPTPHPEPLSETAISALFGSGDDARRTLISAWLDDARSRMTAIPSPTVKDALSARLRSNEPVLQYLPEAFALLASPSSGIPPLDPRPGLKHTFKVADHACLISADATTGTLWYARRGSLAVIYAAAELHQLTSPRTAYSFLDGLLDASTTVRSSLAEVELFGRYIGSGWAGILKSRDGMLFARQAY